MLSDDIIKQISAAWRAHQEDPRRGVERKFEPKFGDIKALVEVAWLASILREEGQEVRFCLMLASPEELVQIVGECPTHDRFIQFKRPIPFNARKIAKIASAFNPQDTALLVTDFSGAGEYFVWGTLELLSRSDHFDLMGLSYATETTASPDFLFAFANGPANLKLGRCTELIGTLTDEGFQTIEPSPFVGDALGKYLAEMCKNHPLFEKFGDKYAGDFVYVVRRLVFEVAETSRGGTILIVDCLASANSFIHSGYGLRKPISLRRFLERVVNRANDKMLDFADRRFLIQQIQRIARLASIDGALVLTSALDAHIFGAKLAIGQSESQIKIGPDAFGKREKGLFDCQSLGTRNQSAISFVKSVRNSVAFVISEDGPVRAYLSTPEGHLLCWPNCDSDVFL